MFQSLFYWKLLWKMVEFGLITPTRDVSILVLLEIALEGAVTGIPSKMTEGFNPCSIGNCSGSC